MNGMSVTPNQPGGGDFSAVIDENFIKWASLAPVAITLGDQQGYCIYANERCCALTGRSLDEMLGSKWANVLHPDDRDRIVKKWQQHVANGASFREEYRILQPGGGIRWVLVEISDLRDASGAISRYMGVMQDITPLKNLQGDQRRLEHELTETRRIESLAAMAGEVAHDFNNMLVGILGGASLALMELPANSPLRETLRMIEQTALNASERTAQLLAFAGRTRANLDLIDINGVIKNTAPALEAHVGRRARLQFFLHPRLPEVMADSAQIRHVLINLALNAAESISDTGGEISITTGQIAATEATWHGAAIRPEGGGQGTFVYIEIKDNGSGMIPEVNRQIFTPFFTTKSNGRGLGLPAVAGIIRTHKGGLTLSTQPGQGTTFRVYFSCPAGAAINGEGDDSEALEWTARPSVLVADDEETVRAVVRQILERQGYSVLEAGNGQMAVEIFQAQHEGLTAVLLDLTMPIMNGEQAFLRMKDINDAVPIILFSGYSEQDALSRFNERGLAGFLQKPFRPQELLQCFNEIAKKKSG